MLRDYNEIYNIIYTNFLNLSKVQYKKLKDNLRVFEYILDNEDTLINENYIRNFNNYFSSADDFKIEYFRKYILNEGFLLNVLKFIGGVTIGTWLGGILSRILGLKENGLLHKFLTSKAVAAALTYEIIKAQKDSKEAK